jgi:hypothetical protein
MKQPASIQVQMRGNMMRGSVCKAISWPRIGAFALILALSVSLGGCGTFSCGAGGAGGGGSNGSAGGGCRAGSSF